MPIIFEPTGSYEFVIQGSEFHKDLMERFFLGMRFETDDLGEILDRKYDEEFSLRDLGFNTKGAYVSDVSILPVEVREADVYLQERDDDPFRVNLTNWKVLRAKYVTPSSEDSVREGFSRHVEGDGLRSEPRKDFTRHI